jgi:SAM-dependent methyltransferase
VRRFTGLRAVARRLAVAAAQRARPLLDRVSPPEPPPAPAPRPFQRAVPVGGFMSDEGAATRIVADRLRPEDVAAIEQRILATPGLDAMYAGHSPLGRRHMLLAFAVHFDVEQAVRRMGLPTAQPPEDVHAMARDPLSSAGGLYEADLVADALASAGVDLAEMKAALDFGCSSGRVLRVLASAYPLIEWHGCDPNGPAIEWAAGAIAGPRFFRSDDEPPLPLPDGSLDLVYAISIWSHFAPALGLRWFDEMHRLLRPGGHLVLTTHGPTTIAYDARHGNRVPEQLDVVRDALYRDGNWYAAEFGETGDWGVVNPEWGTAFLSAEWLLANLCPRWQVLEFAAGRNAGNQDVYVLRKPVASVQAP